MPIKLATPPPGFDQAVRRAVGSTTAAGTMKFASVGAAGAAVSTAAPHPVYTMTLDDIAAGRRAPAAAQPTGWRAFLVMGTSPVAAFDVAQDATGALAADGAVSEGRLVDEAAAAVDAAERAGPVAAGAFELRLLNVPGIYLLALWLHGADDLFVPVMGPGLRPRQVYGAADFFAAVQPAASDLLKRGGTQGAALF